MHACEVLPAPAQGVFVAIARDLTPELSPLARERWEVLCAANPRYYDGPMLAAVSFDPATGEFAARRDRFARLAVQPEVRTGVRLLAVTALLTASRRAPGGSDELVALMGRRSTGTRIYGGLFELGPSGGLPAHPGIDTLTQRDLTRHLAEEISEEAGEAVAHRLTSGQPPRALGVLRDHTACSDDVVLHAHLGELSADLADLSPANWEYDDVCWASQDDARELVRRGVLAPPTIALLHAMNWLP